MDKFEAVADRLVLSDLETSPSWTLVVLECLRDRAEALAATGRLRWVLETAMPYASDFTLYLNCELIESNKKRFESLVEFHAHEISERHLKELNGIAAETWTRADDRLISKSFPTGVTGTMVVTVKSLYSAGGKSEDLGRSHGFFVRVHGRLVNETDPLFGARPLSFATWYRFAAEVEADDLNDYITASRDDFEQSDLKPKLRELLIALFNDARERRDKLDEQKEKSNKQKPEDDRENVDRKLVEQALADALSLGSQDEEADGDWTLLLMEK